MGSQRVGHDLVTEQQQLYNPLAEHDCTILYHQQHRLHLNVFITPTKALYSLNNKSGYPTPGNPSFCLCEFDYSVYFTWASRWL